MVEANWWTVATINSEASKACTQGDWEHYRSLMILREEIIEQIRVNGRYEVLSS